MVFGVTYKLSGSSMMSSKRHSKAILHTKISPHCCTQPIDHHSFHQLFKSQRGPLTFYWYDPSSNGDGCVVRYALSSKGKIQRDFSYELMQKPHENFSLRSRDGWPQSKASQGLCLHIRSTDDAVALLTAYMAFTSRISEHKLRCPDCHTRPEPMGRG